MVDRKLRLVYYYVQKGAAPIRSNPPWKPDARTLNPFATTFPSEGTFPLFLDLLQHKVVDEILMFIESTQSPGQIQFFENFTCRVVPEIAQTAQFLRDDDVIYVRGGWRQWFEFLEPRHRAGQWLMFYRAATNRDRWYFWDVMLEDLVDRSFVDSEGRVRARFIKPTHPGLFFPKQIERKYDVCIGSSHIHDKKGQWRTVAAIQEYERMFGRKLKCVLPGRDTGGGETRKMFAKLSAGALDVKQTGMLDRRQMWEIYNSSRLFVHMGQSGQNDRGVLEALSCGTPVLLGDIRFHDPITYSNSEVSGVVPDLNDPKGVARVLHERLEMASEEQRTKVWEHYDKSANIQKVILPMFARLFGVMREHPKANRKAVRQALGLG